MNRIYSSLLQGAALLIVSVAPALAQDDNLSEISGPASGGSSGVVNFGPGTVAALASPAVNAAVNASVAGIIANGVAITGMNGAALTLPAGMAAGIQSALAETLGNLGSSAGSAQLAANMEGLGAGGAVDVLVEALAGMAEATQSTGQTAAVVGAFSEVISSMSAEAVLGAGSQEAFNALSPEAQVAVATLLAVRAAIVQIVGAAALAAPAI